MQVDIGFGDLVTPEPQHVEYPTVLGMELPRIRAYPPESSIAEKFQVMLHRGEINSRMKDFFDIWALAQSRAFDGSLLAAAIRATCNRRNTPIEVRPAAFTDEFINDPTKQTQWVAFRRRLRGATVSETFAEVALVVAGFLGPLAVATARDEPFQAAWAPGGPWH